MAIAEHSVCQPGKPTPQGEGHSIWRFWPLGESFQRAKSATDSLVKLLDDYDDDVKAAAAFALGELRDKDGCLAAAKAAGFRSASSS